MLTQTDPELTLPSLIASLAGRYGTPELVLTIVFHPDTSRIGQRAIVPRGKGKMPWVLGRRCPAFAALSEEEPAPLDDPHISRRALQFEAGNRHLLITRFEGASRCRVGRSEVHDSISIGWDRLRQGVPLLLGHSIVLLLRLDRGGTGALTAPPQEMRLLGFSKCMADVRSQVERAALSGLDVLIRGETGTGKELVAAAIHESSARRDAPMVSVNMAAVPRELAAAALFGSVRGAFTGAERALPGYFGQAEGGTLFLDEIGDAPTEVQPQLLRALQQREVQVVGGAVRRVDVRVISATDAPLDGDDSNFRAALRYRLGAFEVNLPPLREHPEDIGVLLLHFLQRGAAEGGRELALPGARTAAPDIAAWAVLFFTFLEYPWPGNVRQLENFANQVVPGSERAPTIGPALRRAFESARSEGSQIDPPGRRRMQDIDEDTFDRAMSENGFEVRGVAGQLGVSRAAVYRRIAASPRYRLANEIPAGELCGALEDCGHDIAVLASHFRVPVNSLRSRLRELGLDGQ